MNAIELGGEGEATTRYAWLLATIVVMLGIPAIITRTDGPIPSLELVSTAVLVAALFSLGRGVRLRLAGIGLALPALLANWLAWGMKSRTLDIVGDVLACVFFSLVTVAIFSSLLRSRRITLDTILGGICVYLLIGVVFMEAYSGLEKLAPGSLLEGGRPIAHAVELARLPQLTYFSFVTLSTLGYGDIVPSSAAARRLAAAEAVLGQVYIAVFIARLVGLHLVQGGPRR